MRDRTIAPRLSILLVSSAVEILADSGSSRLAGSHSRNDCGCTGYCVAACKYALSARGTVLVGYDAAAAVYVKSVGRALYERIRSCTDGHNDRVDLKRKLGIRNRLGSAPAAFVRLTELHADAAHSGDKAVALVARVIRVIVAEYLYRVGQELELNALLLSMLDLLPPRGKRYIPYPLRGAAQCAQHP